MTAPTPERCPAVNDGMEGQQCHGDRGHLDLHWIEFDDGVSEWGNEEELWDEIERLRAKFGDAASAHVDTSAIRDDVRTALGSGEDPNWKQFLAAADEVDRLRAVLGNAPHAESCDATLGYEDESGKPFCTCWKADAL